MMFPKAGEKLPCPNAGPLSTVRTLDNGLCFLRYKLVKKFLPLIQKQVATVANKSLSQTGGKKQKSTKGKWGFQLGK